MVVEFDVLRDLPERLESDGPDLRALLRDLQD